MNAFDRRHDRVRDTGGGVMADERDDWCRTCDQFRNPYQAELEARAERLEAMLRVVANDPTSARAQELIAQWRTPPRPVNLDA